MSRSHRVSYMLSFFVLCVLCVMLTACAPAGSTTQSGNGSPQPQATQKMSIGLGYIPDIQFAPFYIAQSKGYYKAAGLDVTFNHGIVPDLFGSMVAGKNTFVFAGVDELLV